MLMHFWANSKSMFSATTSLVYLLIKPFQVRVRSRCWFCSKEYQGDRTDCYQDRRGGWALCKRPSRFDCYTCQLRRTRSRSCDEGRINQPDRTSSSDKIWTYRTSSENTHQPTKVSFQLFVQTSMNSMSLKPRRLLSGLSANTPIRSTMLMNFSGFSLTHLRKNHTLLVTGKNLST